MILLILSLGEFHGWFEYQYTSPEWEYWNLYQEKNYGEMGFLYKLPGRTETYTALSFEPGKIQFKRMHLTFQGNFFSIATFKAEDRHWFDSPLLYLVSSERVRDESYGANAEGVRCDLWKRGYASGFLFSRYTVTEKAQAIIWDLKKYEGFLTWGLLYLKKDWVSSFNEVASVRIGLFKRPFELRGEIAKNLYHPDTPDSENLAGAMELRIVPLGPFIILGKAYSYGLNFRDELSNEYNSSRTDNQGKRGVYGEISYLLPRRAITITGKTYRENLNRYWYYLEAYVEFVNNISFKTCYDVTRDRFGDVWKHAFFEVVAEGKAGRLKFQYKIKDIGIKNVEYSIGQRSIFGIEGKLNLSQSMWFYTRVAFGEDQRTAWESAFFQIAYRPPVSNSEIYLEYGEPSHTDADLVNDGDIADREGITTVNRVRLILKYYF
ncbi:MAG TPA: hypothetical protein ENF18_02490 [candidate division WOR-3 bacterium]|uniref:Uncharacterized protein n=1 Tax=candidate division WOR-3 bacterium TaxID=2052148 RepID=A0A7C0ZKD3_UNCW3|nr:hypothetical protein [candidate division WOR-3 bacterium]